MSIFTEKAQKAILKFEEMHRWSLDREPRIGNSHELLMYSMANCLLAIAEIAEETEIAGDEAIQDAVRAIVREMQWNPDSN